MVFHKWGVLPLLTVRELFGDKDFFFMVFPIFLKDMHAFPFEHDLLYISGGFSISMLLGGSPDPLTITIGFTLISLLKTTK